jgi:short-subunit dehydrogenase
MRHKKHSLKPLKKQVIVITGASSGIGLCTARLAAKRGATVVLAARNGHVLAAAVDRIRADGGTAAYAVADVADTEQVDGIARLAIELFGGFDSWVNDAGVGMYGRLDELDMADKRRLFDINFWGVVNGCRAAIPHLRERGGALINIGSVTSERAIPLLGIYAASKHAVKAYTDTLRMELEADDAPVSVTLIKPASVDTPFFEHAHSVMGVQARPMPPVYGPEVVASAILHCCEHAERDLFIGGAASAMAEGEHHLPRLTDTYMQKTAFDQQRSDKPVEHSQGNLFHSLSQGREHGSNYEGRVRRSSAYTATKVHPLLSGLALAGIGMAVMAGMKTLRARGEQPDAGTRGDVASGDAAEIDVTVGSSGDGRNALSRENVGI